MVIKPMIRNNICMNAHPVGCGEHVRRQIEYVRQAGSIDGPKRVLVIGGSTGYGLASRIVAAFGCEAATVSVAFEKEGTSKRTATAGWYNTLAFDEFAGESGLRSISLNGDAFSHEMKQQVIEAVREHLGQVDLVIYSLASPVRTDPDTGTLYRSALKPIGKPFTGRSLDLMKGEIGEVHLEPASEEEIEGTVKVMGGEDWTLWIEALEQAGVLAENPLTVAYSYIGSELTREVYRDGTIGRAKDHLEQTAKELHGRMARYGGQAYVSVNKAVVTRSSAVIPVGLYFVLLSGVMQETGLDEGCVEQCYRLFSDRLYRGGEIPTDDEGRIRLDDWELRDDVQAEVRRRWELVSNENIHELADLEDYRKQFLQIHGFGYDNVDYEADVTP